MHLSDIFLSLKNLTSDSGTSLPGAFEICDAWHDCHVNCVRSVPHELTDQVICIEYVEGRDWITSWTQPECMLDGSIGPQVVFDSRMCDHELPKIEIIVFLEKSL